MPKTTTETTVEVAGNVHKSTDQSTENFTQFQLKEYENISQAHFKTNEVLATFYRYYILITAIPITTVSLALMRLSENGIGDDARVLAHVVFGVAAILLSLVGAAVVLYIEGLRLDAILYARVVNSIRSYFFKLPGAEHFGESVLPVDSTVPRYDGFGASYIMYYVCAGTNSVFFACGVLVLVIEKSVPLVDIEISRGQWEFVAVCFLILTAAQALVRSRFISNKYKKNL